MKGWKVGGQIGEGALRFQPVIASEAKQSSVAWIAASLTLLAMTIP
jgi:hypothetical protein